MVSSSFSASLNFVSLNSLGIYVKRGNVSSVWFLRCGFLLIIFPESHGNLIHWFGTDNVFHPGLPPRDLMEFSSFIVWGFIVIVYLMIFLFQVKDHLQTPPVKLIENYLSQVFLRSFFSSVLIGAPSNTVFSPLPFCVFWRVPRPQCFTILFIPPCSTPPFLLLVRKTPLCMMLEDFSSTPLFY